jgi:hypothetical protein
MAFERVERRQYPKREDVERDRRDRAYEGEYYRQRNPSDDNPRYGRSGHRHWRGHDYEAEEEFERGRDGGVYGREREPSLAVEHRNRFLRSGEPEERYDRYNRAGPQDWRGRERFKDEDDERWTGPYAGRGPKGYRRSDQRIQEDVCERLTEHPGIDASEIEVAVSSGDVTLSGLVESRAVKHLTEVMVETVSGVREVHNQLRVAPLDQAWSRTPPDERRPQEPVAPKQRQR